MALLPRQCPHCEAVMFHYGSCNCPGAHLDSIDAERAAIKARLAQLAVEERETIRQKLIKLGLLSSQ